MDRSRGSGLLGFPVCGVGSSCEKAKEQEAAVVEKAVFCSILDVSFDVFGHVWQCQDYVRYFYSQKANMAN